MSGRVADLKEASGRRELRLDLEAVNGVPWDRGMEGVRVVSSVTEAADWLDRGAPLLAEERVPFSRELAVLVARSPHGQAAVYPVVETVQVEGICREVLAPAPITEDHALAAQEAALRIAEGLGVTGVFAVEMFDTADGVLVNEVPTWRADLMPYGGVRDSGNTREGPVYAMEEMTERRLVVIQPQ